MDERTKELLKFGDLENDKNEKICDFLLENGYNIENTEEFQKAFNLIENYEKLKMGNEETFRVLRDLACEIEDEEVLDKLQKVIDRFIAFPSLGEMNQKMKSRAEEVGRIVLTHYLDLADIANTNHVMDIILKKIDDVQ